MFGVFLRETVMDYHILVNVEPYQTQLRFLSKDQYSKESDIPAGVKVEFDESSIKLAEYFNCDNCHLPKPVDSPNLNCSCPAKSIVSATGKLIKSQFTSYTSGIGLKLAVRHGEVTSHFVVFQRDVWFDVVKQMNVGDEVTFKAVLVKNDGDTNHNLVKVFHIRL